MTNPKEATQFDATLLKGRYVLEFVAFPILSRPVTDKDVEDATKDARRRIREGASDWLVLNIAPWDGPPDPTADDESGARLLSIRYRNVVNGLTFHAKGFLVNRRILGARNMRIYLEILALFVAGRRADIFSAEFLANLQAQEESEEKLTIYIPACFAVGDNEKLTTIAGCLENPDERLIGRG